MNHATPAIFVLIAANIGVYLLQMQSSDALTIRYALWPLGHFTDPGSGITVGFEPWQLITSAFLHDPGNALHLLFNMFALYMFGRDVEMALGTRRFAWLYGASILSASLVQLLVVTASVDEGIVPTLGASGGVFGVLLAFGVLFPRRRVLLLFPPIPMPAWLLVLGFGVIALANGVLGTRDGVAHFAHLGGMVGAAAVLLLARRKQL